MKGAPFVAGRMLAAISLISFSTGCLGCNKSGYINLTYYSSINRVTLHQKSEDREKYAIYDKYVVQPTANADLLNKFFFGTETVRVDFFRIPRTETESGHTKCVIANDLKRKVRVEVIFEPGHIRRLALLKPNSSEQIILK